VKLTGLTGERGHLQTVGRRLQRDLALVRRDDDRGQVRDGDVLAGLHGRDVSPGSTVVKVVHVTDLRTAINTLRDGNGLGSYSFTDATLSVGSIAVKGIHFSELRMALDQAYQRVGLPVADLH